MAEKPHTMRRRSHPSADGGLDGSKEVFNDEKVVLVMVGLPARYVRLHCELQLDCLAYANRE